ncbi:hypothetical protein [Moritella viscosa]|uniref:hypothetical protein n=1 Tax=Moritella viscosa TaxID=80854 RepID=UPI0009230C75|nr:hypothetical protein [Moritella viscosa]SGY97425.1 HNH endonuclease [Moritella viscosa]
MTIWLLAIDKEHCSYEELKFRKVLAQGWSKIGDLSALLPVKNQDKFKEIINNYISYVYDGWYDSRDPGRIMLNLNKFKLGDYVICCEGESVKGVAKITEDLSYNYDNPKLYEYNQVVFPVTEWRDITVSSHGIKLKSMGPVGIQKYGGDASTVTSLFGK